MVQQGEGIYGAEDRDMEESEELLHGSLHKSVCSQFLFVMKNIELTIKNNF